jgi:hypothetical protein
VNGYIMGDFNADLIKTGTNGLTAEFLGTFTSRGYYPLVSLPTRLTDQTLTLIDNIFTNNLGAQMEAGLVKVRVLDHLPIFAMVRGPGGDGQVEGAGRNQRRAVNERRMVEFAIALDSWDFRELRALGEEDNAARFRNKFRDMYNVAFPVVEDKRRQKDREKPWLDDPEFKVIIGRRMSCTPGRSRDRNGRGTGRSWLK